MKIENVSQTSFRAKFLNKIKIKQSVNGSTEYTDKMVSFVKIDPSNPKDINALSNTATYWDGKGFAKNIYYATCALRDRSKYYKNHEVFALTTQLNDFKNLDGDKILGLVHTSPYYDSPMFIEHIQVNPQYLKTNTFFTDDKKPKYKRLGAAILDSLKRLERTITCFPSSEVSVINFYTKNGFVKHPNILNYYVWNKK